MVGNYDAVQTMLNGELNVIGGVDWNLVNALCVLVNVVILTPFAPELHLGVFSKERNQLAPFNRVICRLYERVCPRGEGWGVPHLP